PRRRARQAAASPVLGALVSLRVSTGWADSPPAEFIPTSELSRFPWAAAQGRPCSELWRGRQLSAAAVVDNAESRPHRHLNRKGLSSKRVSLGVASARVRTRLGSSYIGVKHRSLKWLACS